MKRLVYLLYGIVAYVFFMGTILYAIGFTGNLFVSKTIDEPQQVSLPAAIAIDAALLLLFALQHSIMPRHAMNHRWTKQIPDPLKRSSFLLMSGICLMLLIWLWQPIDGTLWTVTSQAGKGVLLFLFFLGWGLVFISTLLISHPDLFGLRQVWAYYKGVPYQKVAIRTPLFYRFVRHPLYFGFMLAFWCTPLMTASHVFFSIIGTAYILTAIQWEEKHLVSVLAAMLLPFGKKKVM